MFSLEHIFQGLYVHAKGRAMVDNMTALVVVRSAYIVGEVGMPSIVTLVQRDAK